LLIINAVKVFYFSQKLLFRSINMY